MWHWTIYSSWRSKPQLKPKRLPANRTLNLQYRIAVRQDLIVAEPTAPANNSPAAVVAPIVPIKKRRIIDAQLLAGSGYIESQVDIDNFLCQAA